MPSIEDSHPRDRRLHGVLTVLGLCGIALSFVPFTANVVPVTDVLPDWGFWEPLFFMALPCIVLPVPVTVGYAIWLTKRGVPAWLGFAGYALSLLFALAVLTSIALTSEFAFDIIALALLFAAAFAAAAWLVVKKIGNYGSVRGLVAMQCVYAVLMVYFLAAFAGDYQVGAWLGLLAVSAYVAQIVLVVKHVSSLLPFFIPLAGIILLIGWLIGPW